MKIQKATTCDAAALEQLFSIFYKPELKWNKDIIYGEIQSEEKDYYLSIKNQKIIGAFGIKFGNSEAKFGPIAINEEYQRKRIGSKLIHFAEELTKEKGLKKIKCYIFESYNATGFYQKNDWKEEKFIPNFWDGQNCFIYSKDLH